MRASQSDPAFKIWYAIKQNLQDHKGDAFFTSDVNGVEVPGGAEGVKTFSGTVISVDPPDRPTKVVLGVEDPTKPDATLEFSQPLPPDALNTIKVGAEDRLLRNCRRLYEGSLYADLQGSDHSWRQDNNARREPDARSDKKLDTSEAKSPQD